MNNNNLNITDMQTTLFDLDLYVTVKAHVTVKKQSSRKAPASEVNWGDIYDEYLDFEYTSQSWHHSPLHI